TCAWASAMELLQCKMTLKPASCSWRATSAPMRRAPPVMRATGAEAGGVLLRETSITVFTNLRMMRPPQIPQGFQAQSAKFFTKGLARKAAGVYLGRADAAGQRQGCAEIIRLIVFAILESGAAPGIGLAA